MRKGAEATEVEASGRKNTWEGRETASRWLGQAGQAKRAEQVGKQGRWPGNEA